MRHVSSSSSKIKVGSLADEVDAFVWSNPVAGVLEGCTYGVAATFSYFFGDLVGLGGRSKSLNIACKSWVDIWSILKAKTG